jgi:hypothetical protein
MSQADLDHCLCDRLGAPCDGSPATTEILCDICKTGRCFMVWRNSGNMLHLIDGCIRHSPETYQPCVLSDTVEAHEAGHESKRVNGSRAVWATDEYDRNRWSVRK